jgi:methylaspartate ammonia-lyase
MKIIDVICAKGMTGFFFDDQKAIIGGSAVPDGAAYIGKPVTEGFEGVRQAGESISVMLVLDDGQVAWGDCAAVQYSGAGGRDPLFLAKDFIPVIQELVVPRLKGRELTNFREMAEEFDNLRYPGTGKALHTAIRYGVSQALLDAVAKSERLLMCEVVAKEYGTEVSDSEIPIFTQSGDSRYDNADKMIMKKADVMPHGLINNVKMKLGEKGELLLDYVKWLKERVEKLRLDPGYNPVLHIDVYGTIGMIFENDLEKIADYIGTLGKWACPYQLRIEGPVDMGEREGQMLALRKLTRLIDEKGFNVDIVADEWCNTLEDIKYFADNKAGHMLQIKTPDLGGINNTIEAVLYCKEKGISAYQGGTCNETDRSTQVCVHAAMATKPDQVLAKPGMGVDEGFMIVYNEMQRILAIRRNKQKQEE